MSFFYKIPTFASLMRNFKILHEGALATECRILFMAKIYLLNKKKNELKELIKPMSKLPRKEEVMWIDIHEKREDFLAIKDIFKIHPLTVDDCLKKETRIKIEVFDNYLFVIIYGIIIHKYEVKIQEVDFLVGQNFIITNHLNDVEAIHQLHDDPKIIRALLNKGPEFILHYITDRLIESFFPAIEKLDEEIDILEAKIFKKADQGALTRLFKFKQQVMDAKRHTTNHREVIAALAKRSVPFLSPRSEVYFRDVYDKVIRVSDFIEIQREIVANIVETHTAVISNKLNEIIKVLTVITTLTMPAAVIGTWYGMNFRVMPELGWAWSYPAVLAVTLLCTVAMLFYFKRKEWF